MFSKACRYAIKACTFISVKSLNDERVNLKEIASSIDTPEAFTGKILHQLAKLNILSSTTGPKGGFSIEKSKIESTKIITIVSAFDGDSLFNGCALGFGTCDKRHPCAMHDKIVDIRKDLKKMLENTSLYELSQGVDDGSIFLKR